MEIRIDEIPESAGKNLARKALSGLDAFYADPANRERYEAWKAEREVREAGDVRSSHPLPPLTVIRGA